jgi:hypothetical protein
VSRRESRERRVDDTIELKAFGRIYGVPIKYLV